MKDENQKPTMEQVSLWVLEAVEKEWRREPDVMKCRPSSEVLGLLKAEHSITDEDINHAIRFMCSPNRGYLKIYNMGFGGRTVMIPSDNGLEMLGRIELNRLAEIEKKKWSRADKISLASLIFSVFTFFAGYYIGQKTDKPDTNKPALTVPVIRDSFGVSNVVPTPVIQSNVPTKKETVTLKN